MVIEIGSSQSHNFVDECKLAPQSLNFVDECKLAPQFHFLKSLTYRQAAGIQTQVEVSSMTSQMIYILKSPRLKNY